MRGRDLSFALSIACCAFVIAACTGESSAPATEHARERPRSDPADLTPSNDPPAGSWVVLREGATLRHAPNTDEHSTIGTINTNVRKTQGRLVQVEDRFGDFLRVRTFVDAKVCAGQFDQRALLRFYVHVDNLWPVLRSPKEWTFDDGTAIALRPGTPVEGTDHKARAFVRDARLELPVADHELTRWYERPTPPWSEPEVAGTLSHFSELHYGPHHFRFQGDGWAYHHEEQREGRRMLTFDDPCGRLTLIAERYQPNLYERAWPLREIPQSSTALEAQLKAHRERQRCQPGDRWVVPEKATLTWKSTGLETGIVVEDLSLHRPPEAQDDERQCFMLDGLFHVCTTATVTKSRNTCDEPSP